jgi:hypothetical protein
VQINKEIEYFGRIFKPVKCFKKPLVPQKRLRSVIGIKITEEVSKIVSLKMSKHFRFTAVSQHGINFQYRNYRINSLRKQNNVTLYA